MISFTIDGVKYQAEEGMDWSTWTDSEYNVDGYVPISSHATMGRDLVGADGSDENEGYYVKNMSSFVFPYDLIEATSYTTEFNSSMPV